MMNPIDREAAIEAVRNAELWVYYNAEEPTEDIVEHAIMSTKAAIEAEIDGLPTVSPKHGLWIVQDGAVRCSECGEPNIEWDYCPNCGARMRGKENE